MSPKNMRQLFEKTAPHEIISFGDSNLKKPYDGIITQYDWAYAVSKECSSDDIIVAAIIDMLSIMYADTRQKRLLTKIKSFLYFVKLI